jgi:ATP-dependent DNA ligase
MEHPEGDVVFRHACKMGLEGIVSKAPGVRREAEEDWRK